jgi:hypothetical protein
VSPELEVRGYLAYNGAGWCRRSDAGRVRRIHWVATPKGRLMRGGMGDGRVDVLVVLTKGIRVEDERRLGRRDCWVEDTLICIYYCIQL